MVEHGEAPKFILVWRYTRWTRGRLQEVRTHIRTLTPDLWFRHAPVQLDFGF